MYETVYAELNAICMGILFIIWLRIRSDISQRTENVAFRRVVLLIMLILLLDGVWALIDRRPFALLRVLNIAVNAGYLFLTGAISFFWLIYVECRLNRHPQYKKRGMLAVALPLVVLGALCIASPWTGALYSVGPDNVYFRGPYHFMQILIAYSYLIAATLRTVGAMRREKDAQRRMEYMPLLTFMLPPAVGGMLSEAVLGLPFTWPAATLSILIVFIQSQTYQISTDDLTGINNRRQFNRYIRAAVQETHKPGTLYLFLMDINAFKRINDAYGHPEGDEALRQTAQLLRSVCRGRDAFLARYGGDEFALLERFSTAAEAEMLKQAILDTFDHYRHACHNKYELTLSVGAAACEGTDEASVCRLIAEADHALYTIKNTAPHTR